MRFKDAIIFETCLLKISLNVLALFFKNVLVFLQISMYPKYNYGSIIPFENTIFDREQRSKVLKEALLFLLFLFLAHMSKKRFKLNKNFSQ